MLIDIVSKNLLFLRKKHRYSQSELGEALNYAGRTISNWESGKDISVTVVDKLSQFFKVDPIWFFQKHEEAENMDNSESKEPIEPAERMDQPATKEDMKKLWDKLDQIYQTVKAITPEEQEEIERREFEGK